MKTLPAGPCRLLFDPGFDVIDADIVWNDVDQRYQMVFKREGDRALSMAAATSLVPTGSQTTGLCQWTLVDGFGVDESGQSIEAPSQFRYIGRKTWKLGYQKYSGGYNYRIMDMDEHGQNPTNRTDMVGDVSPQHGSFVKITEREYNYLETWEQMKTKLSQVKTMYEVTADKLYKEAMDKAEATLATDGGSFEANEKAMAEALKGIEDALANGTDYRTFLLEQVKAGKATDLTPIITNADFSNNGTGWTQSSKFTNANGYVAEYWNTNFDFYQTISSLPKGEYELGVQSFFRMSDINTALAAHNAGTEQLNAILYANDNEKPVMSLYDDTITQYEQNPYSYPDNVTTANTAFNTHGLYTNTLSFKLDKETDLKIGIRKTEWNNADWCCFDNFTLRFLGSPSSVASVQNGYNEDGKWYNLQGLEVGRSHAKRGIYLHNGQKVVR